MENKRIDFTIAIIGVVIAILLMATSCNTKPEITNHSCRWELCPYKGIISTPLRWDEAVRNYSGCEEGTDCYYIDILHLEYPAEDADQLHDRLFAPTMPLTIFINY